MPLVAMHDSVMRTQRYPIQSAGLGLGDDPDMFEQSYQDFVNEKIPLVERIVAKIQGSPLFKQQLKDYVKKIREAIKQKRWQKAHDMIYRFLDNPHDPTIIIPESVPIASATKRPSSFTRAPHMSGMDSCCPNCASGAPCCGHDHGMDGLGATSDNLKEYAASALLGGFLGYAVAKGGEDRTDRALKTAALFVGLDMLKNVIQGKGV